MTVLLTIVIACILSGVILSLLIASDGENSLDGTANIKILVETDRSAKDLEYALAVIRRQGKKLGVYPEIYVVCPDFSEQGAIEARYLSLEYDAKIITGESKCKTMTDTLK